MPNGGPQGYGYGGGSRSLAEQVEDVVQRLKRAEQQLLEARNENEQLRAENSKLVALLGRKTFEEAR